LIGHLILISLLLDVLQASLRLAALDVSGPPVVAVEISASYI
jgi:hypothetical protein